MHRSVKWSAFALVVGSACGFASAAQNNSKANPKATPVVVLDPFSLKTVQVVLVNEKNDKKIVINIEAPSQDPDARSPGGDDDHGKGNPHDPGEHGNPHDPDHPHGDPH